MEFFKKNQIIILRSLGSIIILLAFVIHFWSMPKEGVSENERAAANVARMEAQVAGGAKSAPTPKVKKSPFLEAFQSKREKQMEYLSILAMILGVGFLGYSFVKPKT
jgi:hypothetical protein